MSEFNQSIIIGKVYKESNIDKEFSPKVLLASEFVAPSYIPYVIHILQDAQKRQVKKLFFISRDAWILLKIAECFPHEGIEYKYIFVSRESLSKGFFYIASEDELKISGFLKYKNINENYKKYYDVAASYLRQEGAFEDNVAFIDVGWFGVTRLMINSFRKREGKEFALFYYYGFHEKVLPQKYGEFNTYVKEVFGVDWSTYVIEEFYSACPYETTIGYKFAHGKYNAVLKPAKNNTKMRIAKTNARICASIAKQLNRKEYTSKQLYEWAKQSRTLLFSTDYIIKCPTLIDLFNSEKETVYKLTAKEIIDYILFVDAYPYTLNIDACLLLTVGKFMRHVVTMMRIIRISIKTKICKYSI